MNDTSVQYITLFYFVCLRNLQFNNTKVTFARIEMCHCHVLKLFIYTLCSPFYYKNHDILLMQRVKRTHCLMFFFFILFSCGCESFEFKILIAHQLVCRNIWVNKNIDKIDQVQLIDIEISCLLSVMKASDRVHFPSIDQALVMHLHICSCAQLPLMLF